METTILSDKAVVAESKIPNYRQQIRRALPDHVFKPDFKNLAWFPVHFSIIGFGLWALTNHFSFWTAPIIAVVMGHSMGCMGFLAHDIMHGGSIRNLFLRDLLGGIGFSPFAISPLLWRKWHNADHHNNTQIKGVDPDHLFTIEEFKDNPVLKALYLLHPLLRNLVIFGSFTFRMTQQQLRMLVIYMRDKDTPVSEKFGMFAQMIVAASAWVALTWFLGPQVFLWGYVVSLMVANTLVISYIATNHFLNPLADERDVLATSLTVTLPKGFRWLDSWHQYFGAHVAHHLFPGASANNTRIIETKAEELFPDRYHSMTILRALQLLWQTPWIYEDNETLYDPVRDERTKTLGHGLKK